MFRMSKDCFKHLCDQIISAVGEKSFKSESFIETHLKNTSIHGAHEVTSGGYISGEVKVALTLRILAGGSYLDIALIFRCGSSYVTPIFHDVLRNWICNDRVIKIPNEEYFRDIEAMKQTANKFSNGRSRGIINGVIGSIDGWLVKIKKPSKTDVENSNDAAGYFSRKGFYAINCQVIVDRDKRVLWRSIKARGGEHDSTAFKSTTLYEQLLEDRNILLENLLYIIGDSAYALCSFLIKPFDNVRPYSDLDSFNYYLSSSRIYVECCFGEVSSRWGIFWKPLAYSLADNVTVIDSALRLHNFVVDWRVTQEEPAEIYHAERSIFDEETLAFMRGQTSRNLDLSVGVHANDDDAPPQTRRGRPSALDTELRNNGLAIRHNICQRLSQEQMKRPDRLGTAAQYRTDRFGRITLVDE
jgi:hypothetical protein